MKEYYHFMFLFLILSHVFHCLFQELIDHAMEDYELIEEFYYNLSTDDFNAK